MIILLLVSLPQSFDGRSIEGRTTKKKKKKEAQIQAVLPKIIKGKGSPACVCLHAALHLIWGVAFVIKISNSELYSAFCME